MTRIQRNMILAAISVAAILIISISWLGELTRDEAGLVVTFIDTSFMARFGDGASVLIQTPGGKNILIDGGPAGFIFGKDGVKVVLHIDIGKTALKPILSHKRISRLDAVVISSLAFERIGGLKFILENFKVNEVLLAYDFTQAYADGELSEDEFFECTDEHLQEEKNTEYIKCMYETLKGILDVIHKRKIPMRTVYAGDKLDYDPEVKIEVLNPPRGISGGWREQTLVFKIIHGKTSYLLTSGISGEGIRRLLNSPAKLTSDILQIPDYGSRYSNTYEFVTAVSPRVAVLQYYYKYGRRLEPEVMDNYIFRGTDVYTTDKDGAIVITSTPGNGEIVSPLQGYKVRKWRPKSTVRLDIRKEGLRVGQVDRSSPHLKVCFIDVGQGDCIFIQTPDGKKALVDGGQYGDEITSPDVGKRIVVPWLKDKGIDRLDVVIMTHPHGDHVGGLPAVLREMEVKLVVEPGLDAPITSYFQYLELIESRGIPRRIVRRGDIIPLGGMVKMEVLNPDDHLFSGTESDLNNNSLVILLTYNQTKFLLTADIEKEAEEELILMGDKLKAAVLKAPHHGSGSSSTRKFLEKVDPQFVVMSFGRWNKHYLPNQRVLDRYRECGAKIYRTDLDGDIEVLADKHRIQFICEKK